MDYNNNNMDKERESMCEHFLYCIFSNDNKKKLQNALYCIDDETQRTACNEYGHGVLYRIDACNCMCFVEVT